MTSRGSSILLIGVDPGLLAGVDDLLGKVEIEQKPIDMDTMLDPVDLPPALILCGSPPPEIPLAEFAQALRMVYQKLPIFLMCGSREGYNRASSKKNGFTDTFLMPTDNCCLRKALILNVPELANSFPSYSVLRLIDLEPGMCLGFEAGIYSPKENKLLRKLPPGQPLTASFIENLRISSAHSLFTLTENLPRFYALHAESMKNGPRQGQISFTESHNRFREIIRDLYSEILKDASKEASFEQGRALGVLCRQIAQTHVVKYCEGDILKLIYSLSGECADFYSHCANVAIYAAAFSTALKIGNPTDLAIAGMLHDIGLVDVPREIQLKSHDARAPAEQKLYQKHVESSVEILKKRRMILNESVFLAIVQHQERADGSGFPSGIMGAKLLPEAQILSMADHFDYMTQIADTGRSMTPLEALNELSSKTMIFDSKILTRFREVFRIS